MRSHLINAVSGAVGLATLAVAAPAASYGGPDSCALSASTVFVTVSQPLTITIHDAPASYVTLGLSSELSTITLTRTNILYSTTSTTHEPYTETVSLSLINAATSTNAATISIPSPSYESTVWETVFATVTNVQLSAVSSGGSVTYSETAASNGLLTFVVENGTTYWLNGQTPPPTASYVVQTSVVTVMPVITPITKLPDTSSSTLTLTSTLYNTVPITIIETLSAANSSTQTFIASSFGTASTPTRSSWSGWNATSTVGSALGTGAHQFTTLTSGTFDPYSTVSFVTEESTLDIYHHHTTTYTLPSYAAKSGFNALTPSPAAETSSSTSTSSTTAYVTVTPFLNSTTSALGPPLSTSQSGYLPVVPFLNSTTLVSSSASAPSVFMTPILDSTILTSGSALPTFPPIETSSAIGEWTTAVINGQTVSWGGPGAAISTSSAPSSSSSSIATLYGNITVSTTLGSTSSIIGVDTTCTEISTLPPTSSVEYPTTSLYTGVESPTTSLFTSASSALGVATSSSSVEYPTTSLYTGVQSPSSLYTGIQSPTTNPYTGIESTTSLYASANSAPGVATSSSSVKSPTTSLYTSTSSALGDFTSSSSSASLIATATSVTEESSSAYTGNISTFWTSQLIATLPTTYTSVSASSESTSTLSSVSSTSAAASALSSSTSTLASSSITSQVYAPSTTGSQTSTGISSTKSAIPSLCGNSGEYGDFTLNFDDIPPMSVGNQNASTVDPEPVFSPYHQFDFSDGWVVVPPPTDPYLPSSAPLLTEFIPNFNLTTSTPASGPNSAEFGYSGDIGNADHGSLGCFSFNVYGASFGCDSTGPDCVFSFTGFRYENGVTTSVISENSAIPACPSLANCGLVPITLDSTFQDLDVIRINVTVAGEPKIWWMDDLKLGWADNSCTAGMCRSGSHIRAVKHI